MIPTRGVRLYARLLALWTAAYCLPRLAHVEELYCRPVLRQDLSWALGLPAPPAPLVYALFALTLAGLAALAAGLRPRLAWGAAFGGFAAICALDGMMIRGYGYLALIQLGLLWLSPFDRTEPTAPDEAWGTRLLKLQLSSVYLVTVAAKLLGGRGWWDGSALVKVFADPVFGRFLLSRIDLSPAAGFALSWATIAVEVFVGLGLWHRRTLPAAVLGSLALHALMLGSLRVSPLFQILMVIHLPLFVPDGWLPPSSRSGPQR